MIKTLYVILPLPTSLPLPNNSVHRRRRNFWARESGIYGRTRVGGYGTRSQIAGLISLCLSVVTARAMNWSLPLCDSLRITRLKFDLLSPSKFPVKLFDTCLLMMLGFCKLVPPPVILHDILVPIKELVGDPNPQVRAAFGENLSGLAPILGKDATIEQLLPMFLQMLKDDDSKVRLNIISKLELVNAGPKPLN
jgi:hypothetical protein